MKSMKAIFVVGVGFLLAELFLTPTGAIADEFINNCTIAQVGAAYGGASIRVSGCTRASTGATLAPTTFYFSENIKNSGMATALTAFSMEQKVNLKVVDVTAGSLVTVINLNQ